MEGQPAGLWAGVAEVGITPALGADLSGYFSPRHADTIERELFVRALALCDHTEGGRVVLVSADLVMVADTLIAEAAAGIAERTGLRPDQLLVSATHSHSTPSTMPELGVNEVDPDYLARIEAAIETAVVAALRTVVPARIGWGQAPVNGVCFNRRSLTPAGHVITNAPGHRTDLVGPAGPTDPTVTGLCVEHRDGRPLAWWTNLSLHYVAAASDTAISSDYYGALVTRLKAMSDGEVHVQTTNGCSGDINNGDRSAAVPVTGVARTELVATAVAGAVLAGAAMASRTDQVAISTHRVEVDLVRAEVTPDDLAAARAHRTGEELRLSQVVGEPMAGATADYFAERLPHLAARPATGTAAVAVVTIGDLCLVGLPGEFFAETGMAIRDLCPYPTTVVVGLTGGHLGYVPPARAWDEGGYETWRNALSWTAPGTAERLVAAVQEIIDEH